VQQTEHTHGDLLLRIVQAVALLVTLDKAHAGVANPDTGVTDPDIADGYAKKQGSDGDTPSGEPDTAAAPNESGLRRGTDGDDASGETTADHTQQSNALGGQEPLPPLGSLQTAGAVQITEASDSDRTGKSAVDASGHIDGAAASGGDPPGGPDIGAVSVAVVDDLFDDFDAPGSGGSGGSGSDLVQGGSGDDVLNGSRGDDVLFGSAGADALSGGAGDDTIFGGAGDDTAHGGAGDDLIFGGAGNDVLRGNSGDDMLSGGAGDDRIGGDGGDDTLFGGDGDDTLDGGGGSDILFGGAGDDRLHVDAADQLIYGGTDNGFLAHFDGDGFSTGDTLRARGGAETDLDSGLISFGSGAFVALDEIENVYLGWQDIDDIIHGNARDNDIRTGRGEDEIYLGQGGNDLITDFQLSEAGRGGDTLHLRMGVNDFALSTDDDFYAAIRAAVSDDDAGTDAVVSASDLILVLERGEDGVPVHSVRLESFINAQHLDHRAVFEAGAMQRTSEVVDIDGKAYRDWADSDFSLTESIIAHSDAFEMSEGQIQIEARIDVLQDSKNVLLSKDAGRREGDQHIEIYAEDSGRLVAKIKNTAEGTIELASASGAIDVGESYQIAFDFGAEGGALTIDGEIVAATDTALSLIENDQPVLVGAGVSRDGYLVNHLEGQVLSFGFIPVGDESSEIDALSAPNIPIDVIEDAWA
jgi:hypothetical protein